MDLVLHFVFHLLVILWHTSAHF